VVTVFVIHLFYLKVDLNIKKITSRTLTGDLTDRLQKLLKAVESVQGSSVESERAFSIAGRFVSKIRNRLGDKTLDSYCFAKQQFLNELRDQPVRRKYSAAE
jgi:hypothetical protein